MHENFETNNCSDHTHNNKHKHMASLLGSFLFQ